MTDAAVWLNGRLLAAEAARIDATDRGFTLGDGVFETIAARAGQPCRLGRHLRRLRDGADRLGIPLAWSDADVLGAIAAVLQAQGLAEAAIRITLTRGPATRGVLPPAQCRPTLLVSAAPRPPALPPARLVVARSTCRNERSPLARIKSLNYLDSILARREAAARGADDAILLNTHGHVAEATAASIVLLLDGIAVTPPVQDGALPGVARGVLLEAGAVRERSVPAAELPRVEAALLVNALGLREVAAVEGRALAMPGLPPALRRVYETLSPDAAV